MGWNIPGRKTLIILNNLFLGYILFAAPLESKNSNPEWKNSIVPVSTGIIGSRNNYKDFKISSFGNYNKNLVEKELNKKSKKDWEKFLKITYKRLEPIRDFIAEEIDKEEVPYEILYLPIIESSAHPMAISYKGATGLWQFMENSIRPYNMEKNEWYDERRDFVKSTKAAIKKLKTNYKVTGDWALALAAYNCGLNRVKTVVRNSGINDYWELTRRGLLPVETSKYVSKLIAVSEMLQDKNSYNIPVKWEKYRWAEIELDSSIDLAILSETSGVPLKILKDSNRELNYRVTPPVTREYKLKVPEEYSDKIVSALSKQENLLEFYKYKIKSGDTLYEIGNIYGVSTSRLIKYNPGISPRALKVGYTLIVPALKKQL